LGRRAERPQVSLAPDTVPGVGCLACACRTADRGPLCRECSTGFTRGGARRLPGGVLVHSAFVHQGTARLLVHRLKYGAHPAVAALLAVPMAAGLPPGAAALVPVPRARLRLWRYGVDPALELARAIGRVSGLPVSRALSPYWWHRRRAGAGGVARGVSRFRARAAVPAGAVLVDDVVTTGSTLAAAAAALGGPRPAVTATAAPGGRTPLTPAGAMGIVIVKPPLGGTDHGSVCAAGERTIAQAALVLRLSAAFGRAGRRQRRSRWRFVSTVSA
jgi:predicted amidophosphoribosyltransferase